MIVRLWLAAVVVLPVLAWVLMVPFSPAPHQGAPGGNIAEYRAQGLLPEPGAFILSREIGHEVFEIPAEDALHRGEEAAVKGPAMPGMAMSEPKQAEHAEPTMPGMAMEEPKEAERAEPTMPGMAMGEPKQAEHAEPSMPGMAMGEPKEAEHAEPAMPGMAMEGHKEPEHAEGPMAGMAMGEMEAGGHGGGGLMAMPAEMAGMAARTIEIEMKEWGFSPPSITVKAGEVIYFKVRNAGRLPHEFMFMPQAGMNAVNYRLERADWNLTEHEASFERMFMCMFPYHMQFGMMGMMMTEGASMEGMNMGGMKM
jgi:uncharacterized cupredoxin-like copper-binding protein